MFPYPLRKGLYFDKDGGGNTDDDTEDAAKKKEGEAGQKSEDDAKHEEKGKAEKTFSQADVDRIVKERLDRQNKKAEDDAEKARKKAEEDAHAKNQEWQLLAEKRQKRIDELEPQGKELETVKTQAEKYKAALEKNLKAMTATLPKAFVPLIEKMDPVEAMEYITAHAQELGVKLETYSETPNGKEKTITDEEKKRAQQASESLVHRSF